MDKTCLFTSVQESLLFLQKSIIKFQKPNAQNQVWQLFVKSIAAWQKATTCQSTRAFNSI